jgi:hypothetical protein
MRKTEPYLIYEREHEITVSFVQVMDTKLLHLITNQNKNGCGLNTLKTTLIFNSLTEI